MGLANLRIKRYSVTAFKKSLSFTLALMLAFGGHPLLSPVLADGYYDENWNWIEETNSYDPWITDTDGDGILDWEELNGFNVEREVTEQMPYSYPVYNPDTGEETWETGSYSYTMTSSVWVTTNPDSADTDQDGLPDGWERNHSGYNPQDATDGRSDNDADGLTNGVEYFLGTLMWLADSDGDGFGDGLEVYVLLTDPLNPDDPASGPDSGNTGGGSGEGGDPGGTGAPVPYDLWNNPSQDIDTDGDGISDYEEVSGYEIDSLAYGTRVTATTNPTTPDTDGDGLSDGWERSNGLDPTNSNDGWYDVDGDGLSAWDEYQRGTDIRNPDTDGDGSMDGASVGVPEPYDPGNTVEPEPYDPRTNPSPDIDSDGDGINDWDEYYFSTDPQNSDTDRDGFMDKAELDGGSDPRDPESTLNNVRRPVIIDTGDGPGERPGIRITTVDLETSKVHLEADNLTSPTTVHVSMRPADGSGAEQAVGSAVIQALREVEMPFNGLPALETTFIARYSYEDEEHESEYDVLLPVDLDIVHPATGELEESEEDYPGSGPRKGGLVALKRDESTPVTQLHHIEISGVPVGTKCRLKIESPTGAGSINVYENSQRTTQVVSEQTEFDAKTERTLYLEGVSVSKSSSITVTQQVLLEGSWKDCDAVSLTVVHAEIPVVMRAFIPHAWTEGEWPVPVGLTYVPNPVPPFNPPIVLLPIASNCVGGNRQDFSDKGYDGELEYKLRQEVIMTPYRELHGDIDLAGNRRIGTTLLSKFYEKPEDVPVSDQNARFGERFVPGATANWEFGPDEPEANYEEIERVQNANGNDVSKITPSLSGDAGHPEFVHDDLLPNIDFQFKIKAERVEDDGVAKIYFTTEVKHNLYPAYELTVADSDEIYSHVYQYAPAEEILPGPVSLNSFHEGPGIRKRVQ